MQLDDIKLDSDSDEALEDDIFGDLAESNLGFNMGQEAKENDVKYKYYNNSSSKTNIIKQITKNNQQNKA